MRRANGTGSIVKMGGERRKPYAVRISARDKRGHVVQKYLSYHRTAKEAQEALDVYNSNAVVIPAENLGATLGDVYKLWADKKYAKAGKSSVASYRASWVRISSMEHLKMRSITIDHLQAIIDADEKECLSKSSISNDNLLIKSLFKFAMERDIISKDYSAYVQIPAVGAKYEKGAFTDLQLKEIEKMATAGVPWADTVLMLCYTGFRITEFLSLTKESYNEKEDYLQGGIKTEAGKNRIVPVHPKIKPYLMQWIGRNGKTIIFGEDEKQININAYRNVQFLNIAQKLGMPQATPHWCRHTFSTRLHAAGVPELEQKRLMGHADKNITDHYTHTSIEQLRKAILMLK